MRQEKAKRIAIDLVDDLMTNTDGRAARLVLEMPSDDFNGAGWSAAAMTGRIARLLMMSKNPKKDQQQTNDELTDLRRRVKNLERFNLALTAILHHQIPREATGYMDEMTSNFWDTLDNLEGGASPDFEPSTDERPVDERWEQPGSAEQAEDPDEDEVCDKCGQ